MEKDFHHWQQQHPKIIDLRSTAAQAYTCIDLNAESFTGRRCLAGCWCKLFCNRRIHKCL
jgi:hypothetical protein